jgi:hypothetical protein
VVDEIELYGEFDAKRWAKEFLTQYILDELTLNEETLTTWFSNALMTGYDKAHNDAYTQLRKDD